MEKAKYQLLIIKRKVVGLEEFNNSKNFNEQPNNMNDSY